jgi:Putative motility protein
MDMGLVMAVMMMQAAHTQQQVGNAVLKSNLDSQKNDVLTILGSPSAPSTANLGPGVGGNLNVTA